MMRVFIPLTFLCVGVGVVYGIKTFLQRAGTESSPNGKPVAGAEQVKSTVLPILEPEDNNPSEVVTESAEEPTLPVGAPPMPAIGDSPMPPPAEYRPADGGVAAMAVLEKFLGMKSLAERMPHMETKLPETELQSSLLNGPLPEVLRITVDVTETNAIEQVTDYYHHVHFAQDGGTAPPQTMLVRTRGTSPPKVVVDPFLDLFGGRFARYAENPVEEAGTFQVIISAGAFCYDDIPASEKKYTLKILARDDTKEIAKAYFSINSKIGEMLKDETSGLAYGQAKACTVFMRWNTEEDPQRPFLEALDITSLNWNP